MQIYYCTEQHDNFVRFLVLFCVLVKFVIVDLNSESN